MNRVHPVNTSRSIAERQRPMKLAHDAATPIASLTFPSFIRSSGVQRGSTPEFPLLQPHSSFHRRQISIRARLCNGRDPVSAEAQVSLAVAELGHSTFAARQLKKKLLSRAVPAGFHNHQLNAANYRPSCRKSHRTVQTLRGERVFLYLQEISNSDMWTSGF